MATIKKACKGAIYPKSSSVSKRLGSPSKAKTGGSFPDLNKDGKVTKKDILIGKGVLPKTAKKGMKVKKAQDGDDRPIGNKVGNRSSYSELESGKKFDYIEGPDRSFGVARRKQMPSGNSKVKAIQYDMGFVPSNARITKQKLDSEGNVIKSKEKPISVNRASRMMKRKGVSYKKGGTVKKSSSSKMKMMKSGGKMTKKCAYGCK